MAAVTPLLTPEGHKLIAHFVPSENDWRGARQELCLAAHTPWGLAGWDACDLEISRTNMDAFLNGLVIPDVGMHPLTYTLRHCHILCGLVIELGVFSGRTIREIAQRFPDRIIYGFDSFEGLPEDWRRPDLYFPKGAFHLRGCLPTVPNNVCLVKGWFEDTLPRFRAQLGNQPIALLHIDCDLYSSTKTALRILGENLVDGSILVFDEFVNYPTFEQHEIKAFWEYLQDSGRSFSFIGKHGPYIRHPLKDNGYHDQPVALRLGTTVPDHLQQGGPSIDLSRVL